jgi:TolA-binding protein
MRFFYKLFFTFLFLSGNTLLRADVGIEQQIITNEQLIEKLQKQIDDLIKKQNLLIVKKNNLNASSGSVQNSSNLTENKKAQALVDNACEAKETSSVDDINTLKERILALEKKLDSNGKVLQSEQKSPYENDISNEETYKANADNNIKASFLPEAGSKALAQYEQANSLLQKNNKQDAKFASESFRYIIETFPNDPIFKKAYVKLGRALLLSENYEEAKNIFNYILARILQTDKDDLLIAETYLDLLETYRLLNDKVGYNECLNMIQKLHIKFDSEQQTKFDTIKK